MTESFTLAKLQDAIKGMEMNVCPFFASSRLLPFEKCISFTHEGREYLGAGPEFWRKVPLHMEGNSELTRLQAVHQLWGVPIVDLDKDEAKALEWFGAYGKVMADHFIHTVIPTKKLYPYQEEVMRWLLAHKHDELRFSFTRPRMRMPPYQGTMLNYMVQAEHARRTLHSTMYRKEPRYKNYKHRRNIPTNMKTAKPPYRGDAAFTMGWPCVPPYQMKKAKKQKWIAAWQAAAQERISD